MSEDEKSSSEDYETDPEPLEPVDKFVTLRKKEKMVKGEELEAEAARLRAELAAKEALIAQLNQRLTVGGTSSNNSQVREVARRPDFRELRELVSKFDPKQATCLSAEEWIAEIDTTAAHYDWDGSTKLHCARLNLEGSAKLWWAGVQDEATTWAIFSAKLVRAYPSARDPIYYHTQMTKRRKMRDETIEEYVYSQVALGKRAGFDEAVVVKYVIAGLGEFLSKSRVQLGGRIETVEELISQLKWMEGMNETPTESSAGRMTERKKEKVATCYRCNQSGHKAVSCPKIAERNCYNCGVSGHMAKNCPNLKPKAGHSRMFVVDEENNFVRNVEIKDMKLNALIDSGCKVSTIQSRFAEKAGSSEKTNTTLVGFGGKKVNVDKVVKTVIKLDGIEVPVKLNVVPNWSQSTALILGRDMLNSDGLVMVKRNGKLEFHRDRKRSSISEEINQKVVEVQSKKYETMFTIDSHVKSSDRSGFTAGAKETAVVGKMEIVMVPQKDAAPQGKDPRLCEDTDVLGKAPLIDEKRQMQLDRSLKIVDARAVLSTETGHVLNEMRAEQKIRWDEQLQKSPCSVNNTLNSTTNLAPNALVLPYQSRGIHQNEIALNLKEKKGNVFVFELRQRVRSAIDKRQRLHKQHFDKRRRKLLPSCKFGDMVLVKRDSTAAIGHSRNVVKTVLRSERVELEEIPGLYGSGRTRTPMYAAGRIKRWYLLDDLDGYDDSTRSETATKSNSKD